MPPSRPLVLLSDSTGDLGERFLRALTSQFPKGCFAFRIFSFLQHKGDVEKVFREIGFLAPIVFHTTVDPALKKTIRTLAKQRKIPEFDLTGDAMRFLERVSKTRSTPNLPSLHELNQEYEQRIAALNFTVEHDDGMGMATWEETNLLLVGVSRTSKTPTSIYLANKGYKVANVPLVKGIPLPRPLAMNPKLPIIGLTIDPHKLHEIRLRRAEADKIPGTEYADIDSIRDELKEARSVFEQLKCPVINVSQLAVEEVAALIQKELHLR